MNSDDLDKRFRFLYTKPKKLFKDFFSNFISKYVLHQCTANEMSIHAIAFMYAIIKYRH